MLIEELQIRAFGCFTGMVLTLSSPEQVVGSAPGLHVVMGANGAGKTTTLYALRNVLYGFADLRNDPKLYNQIHATTHQRIAVALRDAAGTRIAFTRRKRRGDTCFDFDDAAASPAMQTALDQMLIGIDRDLFERKYGIDHERLRAGGEALASGDGALGESLFAAATGIDSVRATIAQLQDQVNALLAPSGRTGTIKEAVARYTDAQKSARRAERAAREWTRAGGEEQSARQQLEAARADLLAADAQLQQLTRIQDVLVQVVQRRELVATAEAMVGVPDQWSVELEQQRIERDRIARESAAAIAAGERDLASLGEKRSAAQALINDELISAGDRLVELVQRVGAYRTARADLPTLSAGRATAEDAVSAAARAVRPGATADDYPKLVPAAQARAAASELLATRAAIDDAVARCATDRDRRAAELARLLATAPPAVAPDAHVEAVSECMNQVVGIDYDSLARRDQRVEDAQQQIERRVASLPRSSHTIDELLTLSVPLAETVTAMGEKISEAVSAARQAQAAIDQSDEEVRAATAELDALTAAQQVPTPEALVDLRGQRESIWRKIRAAWVDGNAPDAESPSSVAEAFEDASQAADTHVDDMVRAGELVGQAAEIRLRITRLEARRDQQTQQLHAARRDQDTVAAEWRSVWTELDVEGGSPAEMREWLEELRGIRDVARQLAEDRVEAGGLRKRAERVRADLVAVLTAAGEPPAADDISVEVLTGSARRLLDRVANASKAAAAHQMSCASTQELLTEAERKLEIEQAALVTWQEQWAAVAPQIGLDAGALPAAGSAACHAIDELETALTELEAARQVHFVCASCVESFETDVAGLLAGLGPVGAERAASPPDEAVTSLAASLEPARTALVTSSELDERIAGITDGLERHRVAAAGAGELLDELCAVVGCSTSIELDEIAGRWAAREQLRRQIAELEQAIIAAAFMSAHDVELHLGETPPEQLPMVIEQARTRVEQARDIEQQRSARVDEINQQLGALREEAVVEVHIAAMDDARSQIEELSKQYVSLKLQLDLLQGFLRDQAGANMGDALRRASDYFVRLTCSEYSGIVQDVDDKDREVLRARPANGGVDVDVVELSEGTRDQLFLALRLASIDEHLARPGAEPIPFIVDDVLTTFDDARSAATMEVLGELAQRTQVLFFTHHAHLVDLARANVEAELLSVHELAAELATA